MAYLIEILLLPFLGFPHTPFLTVIANRTTLSTGSSMLPAGGMLFLLFKKSMAPHGDRKVIWGGLCRNV